MSKLFVVGTGPGDLKHMTYEARSALEAAEVVVGYKTYLDLVAPLLWGKDVVSSGMRGEVERCREALLIASEGRDVALVSGGDAGIYGMAGLVLELARELQSPPEVVIVPGVSAVQAAAAVLGAPLMHDFAVISLSDLLTPWDAIERRLAAVAAADFVVALYNPRSKGRVTQIEEAQRIMLAARSATTPVGIVRNALRAGEERVVTTLEEMLDHDIDMFSLVIIGNSTTFVDDGGRMITPRGYDAGTRNPGPDYGPEGPGTGKSLKTTAEHRFPVPNPRSLMICGTGSDVGKSVLTAGLCRILKRRGLNVAPFKSQNMALNSAVTPEGGEIGRAQAVQAAACCLLPHTDMNPVLLKPNSDTGSQVIVQGKVVGTMAVREYNAYKPKAFRKVEESYGRLASAHDFVVIEGAGSIAEINLKAHDIANLRVAKMAGCPAILVADIDRGGVFAQIVGTLELLEPSERALVKGVVINKFRGDPSLLTPGIDFVERRTGVPVLGVVPYFTGFRLPEEDSVALARRGPGTGDRGPGTAKDKINVGVVKLPRISNYTDFDTLEAEPDVELRYIEHPHELTELDLLILPGSKSTIADLFFLMENGLFGAILAFPGQIAGICGGFQMLGKHILDPVGVESSIVEADGLGLLDATTTMLPEKETHQVEAQLLQGGSMVAPKCRSAELNGYEIHMGETLVGEGSRSFAFISSRSGNPVKVRDGAVSSDGRVFGTYLHGIFDNIPFRTAYLNRIRKEKGLPLPVTAGVTDDPFDLLAVHLEKHLDMERLLAICGLETTEG
ncbi:cobyric acid synthase [Geomobilimonas luticola]|uniref:Cobyric acid synthase n=1 Tax=Geomobilimonas luticola TaxID=1114878 RepID=A0ABS5SA08_9BACT|nr:cobyric acid synthase [Geomobilimonas luticola]MBT0652218.1 cobyric acid synthase [Geomobilimonas luticola]